MTETVDSKAYAGDFPLATPAVAKDPGEYFETLRTQCPVAHSEASTASGSCRATTTSTTPRSSPRSTAARAASRIPCIPQPPVICIEQDDPEHRKYRKPLQGWFSVKRIQELEDKVREIVTSLIDEVIDEGQGDLAEILAAPVPPMVIALDPRAPGEGLGVVPRARERRLLRLAQTGDMEGAAARLPGHR